METVAISKFKAECLALLKRVKATGQPLLVTKRGEPVAQIVPPPEEIPDGPGYGALSGSASEVRDIVDPLPDDDWEALG